MTGQAKVFSLVVQPSTLGPDEACFSLSADAVEREELTRRFDLVSIGRLDADLGLKWVRGGQVLCLRGTVGAEITQTCVVTLAPVRNNIEETFEILYQPAPAGTVPGDQFEGVDESKDGGKEGNFPAGPDAGIEPFYGDSLDIAEMAARELALAIDPYPRKSGVKLEFSDELGDLGSGQARGKSPFEVLAELKGKK